MLNHFYKDSNEIQVGIDEAGRGCFAGPVVAAAVIWDTNKISSNCSTTNQDNSNFYNLLSSIDDSKKIKRSKRKILSDFIKQHADYYNVYFVNPNLIDTYNILESTYIAMHGAIDGLKCNHIDRIIVDGNRFKPYVNKYKTNEDDLLIVPHECIIGGDASYLSIASASILAKVARDDYMDLLCDEDPSYQEKYDWRNNKGYGTKKHIEGIKKWGICTHHRRTFGICKEY